MTRGYSGAAGEKKMVANRKNLGIISVRREIEDLIDAEFEGKMYPVPRQYDKILKECYGDYMKLPPEDKQQPTHDIVECRLG